jgi:abequosyltransferase
MNYILSICIPTFNRGGFIRETIESIVSQYTNDVEIVISDNASTDGTDEIVRNLQKSHERITYYRSESNVGADRNFLKVIELASGTHCWLMGSDDAISPEGVATVLEVLAKFPHISGFSVNRVMYDYHMTKVLPDMDIFPSRSVDFHVYDTPESAFSDLGIYLSFISGQIFHTDSWRRYSRQVGIEKYFNGLVHLYIFAAMIKASRQWGSISKNIVQCRRDNDSFLSAGHFNRFQIDVIGFSRAAEDIYGKGSALYVQLMRDVLRSLLINRVIGFKLQGVTGMVYVQSFLECLPICWRYQRFWSVFLPVILIPSSILSRALNLRTKIKKLRSSCLQ